MRIAIALVLAVSLVGAGVFLMSGSDDPIDVVDERAAEVVETSDENVVGKVEETGTAEVAEVAEPEDTGPTQNGTGAIFGSVERFDGSAVAGARVRVELINWSVFQTPPEHRLVIDVTADELGNFEVDRLPEGGYALSASDGTQHGTASTAINPRTERANVRIQVLHSNSIRGRVEDGAGNPIANAVVLPWRGQQAPGYPQVVRGITDAGGAFEIHGLATGEHRLVARAREYAPTMSDWVLPGDEDVVLVLAAGATVSGIVRHQDTGEPAVRIQVTVRSTHPYFRESAGTDAEGKFVIPNVADDRYALVVEHGTLVMTEDVDLDVEGADIGGIEVEVGAGAIVLGRVLDGDGAGVEGVEVNAGYWDPVRGSSRSARTDAEGRFRMEGLVRGTWHVHRQPVEGYPNPSWNEAKRVKARIGATIDGIDFRLLGGLVVYGRTVDGEGSPIAEAKVSGWNDSGARQEAVSDADGRFQLAGFEFGDNLRLEASARRLVMVPTARVLEEEQPEELELVLEPEARLGGMVVDGAGEPVADITVNVQRTEGFTNQSTQTDSKGRFSVGGLATGEYSVRAQRRNVHRWGQPEQASVVRVESGQVVDDHRIVYDEDGLTIRGRVLDRERRPVAQANLWSYRTSAGRGGGMGASAVTDEDGYYVIEGLTDGTYRVQVNHASYANASKDEVVAGDEGVDFELAGRGSVSGRVVDGDGVPVPRYELLHMQGKHTKLRGWGMNFTVFADADGRFVLEDLEEGVNTIVVRADEYVDAFHVIEGVSAGESVEDVEISLESGRIVQGVVLDANDEPVRGVRIYIGGVPRAWEREARSVATTDANGEFRFSNISAGTAELSAHHPEYATASVTLQEHSDEVEFVLTRGGVIRGRVQVEGKAPGRAWVNVASDGGSDEGMNVSADGTYRFAGRPAGDVVLTVHVWDGPRREMSRPAVIEEAGETVVDFDFLGGDASLAGNLIGEGLEFNRARVSLRFEGEVEGAGESFHARADASGRFSFVGLPAGEAHLLVEMGGMGGSFRQQGVDVVIPSGGTVTQNIEIGGGSVITGTLTGIEGAAMKFSAAVRGDHQIESLDLMTFQVLQSKVAAVVSPDEEGKFQLDGLDPGTYTIICIAFDEQPQGMEDFNKARLTTQLIEVGEKAEIEVNLHVPPKK